MVKYSKTISKSKKKDQEACLEYLDDLLRKTLNPSINHSVRSGIHLNTSIPKEPPKSNTPRGRANLALPIAFQQIEPFVDNLSELMFGETPYIVYTPRNSRTRSTKNQQKTYLNSPNGKWKQVNSILKCERLSKKLR
jgi:hypothetical protein